MEQSLGAAFECILHEKNAWDFCSNCTEKTKSFSTCRNTCIVCVCVSVCVMQYRLTKHVWVLPFYLKHTMMPNTPMYAVHSASRGHKDDFTVEHSQVRAYFFLKLLRFNTLLLNHSPRICGHGSQQLSYTRSVPRAQRIREQVWQEEQWQKTIA